MSRALVPLLRPVARARIARGLDGLVVRGLEEARTLATRTPILLAANHVGWWDGMLLFVLDEALGLRSHVLMDRQNLDRLAFFQFTGAVPLDRSSGFRARHDLLAAASRLSAPGDALWVFPQGRQRAAHLRPLGFERGVTLLGRTAKKPIVPVAIQYAFLEQDRPRAFVSFGAPLPWEARVEQIEAAVESELAAIDAVLAGESEGLTTVVPAPTARPEDGPWTRVLGVLARGALVTGRP